MASDTRDRLIRATSRLLRLQGYGATGLNQVMAEADAPKGSMYFHFPGGKEELAAVALDRFSGRVVARLSQQLEDADTVGAAVAGYLDGVIAGLERTDFAEGCAVATVALDAAAGHPALAEVTKRALEEWTSLLTDALVAEGRPPGEARRLATLAVVVVEGSVVMGKGTRSTEPIAAVRDAIHAILAPRRRSGLARSS